MILSRLAIVLALVTATTACKSSDNPPTGSYAASLTTTSSATYCTVVDGKADRRCTPGAVNSGVTQDNIYSTICVPGWTKTVRPPTSYTNLLKTSQMSEYGETGAPKDYEEDHLIPLAIGGDPQAHNNLWPEPWIGTTGARKKDAEENRLHRAVCSGGLTLAQAREQIVANWTH